MNVPSDILLNEMYKYLSYKDLKVYSRTNSQIYNSVQEFKVWQYLLMRDFGITSDDNPQKDYFLYRKALLFLSQYYNIITQQALICFVKFIDSSWWNLLDEGLSEEPSDVLSIKELEAVLEYSISDLDYYHFGDQLSNIKQYIKETTDYDVIKQKYKNLGYTYKNVKSIINRSTFLFYYKQLKKFQYDIDLAESLPLGFKDFDKLQKFISTELYFQYGL